MAELATAAESAVTAQSAVFSRVWREVHHDKCENIRGLGKRSLGVHAPAHL
jgi:hypothetical protein